MDHGGHSSKEFTFTVLSTDPFVDFTYDVNHSKFITKVLHSYQEARSLARLVYFSEVS